MADLKALAESIIKGKRDDAVKMVKQALEEKVPVGDILNKGLIAGMNEVGRRFKAQEFYVPEVLIAARAMKSSMEVLQPLLVKAGIKPVGTIVVGTVKGDLHDIGKNLVAMMLQGAGFDVKDAGIDVEPAKFAEEVKKSGAQVCALSALLTTTMPRMADVVKLFKAEGVSAKIMIGGAPVTQSYADEIGADGYAPDAASAVDKARQLVGIA
ncbi:MAG TPA: corrinoid protein [Candidatus Brocadiia bacterium]|nr:corrinoid protein [Candidatus Brocadiia bacterium]